MRSAIFVADLVDGTWRSLVAHHNGVVGVGGSNPPVPTILFVALCLYCISMFNAFSFRSLSTSLLFGHLILACA